jgi:hypothetical protein
MNITLAKQVVAFARQSHTKKALRKFAHDQTNWYQVFTPVLYSDGTSGDMPGIDALGVGMIGPKDYLKEGVCRTSACLAGIAVILSPDAKIVVKNGYHYPVIAGHKYDWPAAGRKLLDLTPNQTELFWNTDDKEAINELAKLIKKTEALTSQKG